VPIGTRDSYFRLSTETDALHALFFVINSLIVYLELNDLINSTHVLGHTHRCHSSHVQFIDSN